MNDFAIRIRGLGKAYRIGARREKYRTLRDAVTGLVASPLRRLLRSGLEGVQAKTIWALKDVSLDVPRGTALGIVGRNGAGKTTLLKVLSRITEPTRGVVEIRGRVGSLLEVGTGFHPELSGRENIYLNGAILGMRREEIRRKFDEIVAFADIAEFVDTPVKHYSSGMYMRLAFSVAAHLEPEVLLVDEVLAVGDAAFRKKCLGKMGDVAHSGRTVLFVSHSMSAVEELCGRAIWIEEGTVRAQGEPREVIDAYLASLASGEATLHVDAPIRVTRVALRNGAGEATNVFAPGDSLQIDVEFDAATRHECVYFRVIVTGHGAYLFGADMLLDGNLPAIEGHGTISCRFPRLPLTTGTYGVLVGILDRSGRYYLFKLQEVISFTVSGNLHEAGLTGELANTARPRLAPVVLEYEWMLPDGTRRRVPRRDS